MKPSTPEQGKTPPPAKPPRTRSPAYPSMSLRAAVEKAQAIWNAQQKHPAHIDAVLNTIGYSKGTGPALRAIAALSQYGFTTETGNSGLRKIGLSDMAINYLLSNSEQEKTELLRQAAVKPTIFQHLWTHYGPNPPNNDEAIKSHLIRDKNYNAAAVGELVASYRDTFDFANLGGNGGLNEKKADTEDGKPPTIPPPYKPPTPHSKGTPPMSANIRYLSIPLDIGDAPVPLGMSKDDWKIFIEALKVFKPRIVKDADESTPDSSLDDLLKEE